MRSALLVLLSPLLATGCIHEVTEVTMSGVVLEEPGGEGDPAAGVEISSLDADRSQVDQATTDESGAFSLLLAAQQDMFLELRGDGYVTTLFAGESGVFDWSLADGELYVRGEDVPAQLVETFGDCAAGAEGGIIEGEVRVYMPGEDSSDMSLVGNAWVTAYDSNDIPYEPCYLDENGDPAPEEQGLTNSTGRFAIFGLPADEYMLEVAYKPGATESDPDWEDAPIYSEFYNVHMLEDGLAPFYPAFVEWQG